MSGESFRRRIVPSGDSNVQEVLLVMIGELVSLIQGQRVPLLGTLRPVGPIRCV